MIIEASHLLRISLFFYYHAGQDYYVSAKLNHDPRRLFAPGCRSLTGGWETTYTALDSC